MLKLLLRGPNRRSWPLAGSSRGLLLLLLLLLLWLNALLRVLPLLRLVRLQLLCSSLNLTRQRLLLWFCSMALLSTRARLRRLRSRVGSLSRVTCLLLSFLQLPLLLLLLLLLLTHALLLTLQLLKQLLLGSHVCCFLLLLLALSLPLQRRFFSA
jgi:hypothetical protein